MFNTSLPDLNTQRSKVRSLTLAMQALALTSPVRHGQGGTQHSAGLDTAAFVFIRDPTKTSLGRPFRGSYQVLDRNAKYYRLDIDGKVDNVSIDRLKPATGLLMDDARVPSHVTIRGRHVYPPLGLDCGTPVSYFRCVFVSMFH
ncbi:hypothetical protein TCAL_14995 [Tigriopus californicus]|uniref:Uncharacterized protein n=1 Tax=Tigriopus californicus TaxID=6832 RepID=A0A553N7K8_TIGCA|nr:hypothetical protein TCAL_14995 [Tigriopus californicus]